MIRIESLPTDVLGHIVGTHLSDIKDRIRFCLGTTKTILGRLGLSCVHLNDNDTNDREVDVLFRHHTVSLRKDQLDQYLGFRRGRHVAHAKEICIIFSETSDKIYGVEGEEGDVGTTTVVLKGFQDATEELKLLMTCESELQLRIDRLVLDRTKHIDHQISFQDFVALKTLEIRGWDATSLVLTESKLPLDLENLSLSDTYIATNSNSDLPITFLPKLKSLEIRQCYCHAPIDSWLHSAVLCKNLERLAISSCEGMRDSLIANDILDASHCEHLKYIEVRDLAWNPLRSLKLPASTRQVDLRNSGIDKITVPNQGSDLEVLKLSSLNVFLDDFGHQCKHLWVPAEDLFRIPSDLLLRLREIDITANGQQWYEYVERYVFEPLMNSDPDAVALTRCTFHINQTQIGSRRGEQILVSSSREFLNTLLEISSRWRRTSINFAE